MSQNPITQPLIDTQLKYKNSRIEASWEASITPINRLFTTTQTCNQHRHSTETLEEIGEEPLGVCQNSPNRHLSSLLSTEHISLPQNQPNILNLELWAALLTLARQFKPHLQCRQKRVQEPDLFSGGSLEELQAFVFQC